MNASELPAFTACFSESMPQKLRDVIFISSVVRNKGQEFVRISWHVRNVLENKRGKEAYFCHTASRKTPRRINSCLMLSWLSQDLDCSCSIVAFVLVFLEQVQTGKQIDNCPTFSFFSHALRLNKRTLPPVIKCFLTMLVPDACQSSSQLLSTSTLSHMRRRQSSSTCLYKVLLTRSTKFTNDKPVSF